MRRARLWPGNDVLAVAIILGLTAWRLAWLPASDLEFYVDEAQYWLWGQEMAAGAWSKPPLVGWLIRAANQAVGSDAVWVARLPWPMVHGAAALAVLGFGRRLAGPAVGALAGVIYVTLPAVSVGSILISTDSPQMLALALFLLAWVAAPGRWGAALAGAALAGGMWSKYAMLFPLPGLAVAAWIDPRWRRRWSDAAIAGLVALVLFAPNLAWNAAHSFATIRHTAQNADWQGGVHLVSAARFLADQLAVAGPLTFAALLAAMTARQPAGLRGLGAIAAAPLAIVTAQAIQSEANGNWGVGAYVPGAVLMAAWLARRPRLAVAAVALNAVVATGLPVIGTKAATLRVGGNPVLTRYIGNEAVADAILTAAGDARLIVSADRALLAELTWRGKGRVAVRAVPAPGGPVPSHFDMVWPLRSEPGPAIWVGGPDAAPACAAPAQPLPPGQGDLGRRRLATAALTPACLETLRRPSLVPKYPGGVPERDGGKAPHR